MCAVQSQVSNFNFLQLDTYAIRAHVNHVSFNGFPNSFYNLGKPYCFFRYFLNLDICHLCDLLVIVSRIIQLVVVIGASGVQFRE